MSQLPYPTNGLVVSCLGLAVVVLAGCDQAGDSSFGGTDILQEAVSTNAEPDVESKPRSSRGVIVSDGPITIDNGEVTFGPPEVTEQVERKIYKSLSYFRDLARAIERKVPGGNRGSRQCRQDYDVAAKSFMMRYQLSEAEINSIVRKGDEQGWK